MGIPYLSRHLASFSESTLLGSSHDPSCKTVKSVVIDGPGLVHYVHSVLLSQASNSLTQVERQPSCDEVSGAVMTYLVLLQTSGVNILRIYFDGALPLNKRETRLSRLEASRKQLEIFCLSHREDFKWSPINRRSTLIDPVRLLQDSHTSLKRSLLPGNPFMVSAVVEDLRSRWTCSEMRLYLPRDLIDIYEENDSRYPWSGITEMIPGEADVFCAALAAQNPGTAILTSDSDLFLFDLGPESAIIFFDTIRVEGSRDKMVLTEFLTTIKAMKYRPASIADRLGIPALSYLAHELNQSPRSKLAELVRRAKIAANLRPKTPAYLSFLEEFDLKNFLQYDPAEAHILQILDTRVSELFVQCLWADNSFQDQHQAPRIYLPFLVENHSRKCAWAESVRFRRLAYSLLNLYASSAAGLRFAVVTECVRRGKRFCFDNIDLYSTEKVEVEKQSAILLDELESFQMEYRLHHHTASYDSPLLWRTFALYEIHKDWFTTNHDPSPIRNHLALKIFLGLNRGSEDDSFNNKTFEWDDIHALAQLQAVLYSIRMVYQIIQSLAVNEEAGGGSHGRLRDILARLPPLHVLMRSLHEVRRELYGFEQRLTADTKSST